MFRPSLLSSGMRRPIASLRGLHSSPLCRSARRDFVIDPKASIEEVLSAYEQHIVERTTHHLGYPYNLEYNHEELFGASAAKGDGTQNFMRYSINNLGDPYRASNYGVHSRPFELEVVNYFATLWKLPLEEAWGYVTCSGTEGNMHAMIVARECLPGAPVYFSTQTHYSIAKSAGFYCMDTCPVATQAAGDIDIDDFRQKLLENKARGIYTAIVNVNCGTTVRGGIDNLDRVVDVLDEVIGTREQYHIHVDGALFAQILPHLAADGSLPVHDFSRPIASLSVSGHKMMGCPMPSGVVVHRKENIKRIEKRVEYLNSYDTTIMGSRNGQSPLFMWLSIKKKGIEGFREDARLCIEMSKYIYQKFLDAGFKAMLNDYSNTLVFPRPPDENLIQKWQLACTLTEGHICIMPSTSKEKLDEFFHDYQNQAGLKQ